MNLLKKTLNPDTEALEVDLGEINHSAIFQETRQFKLENAYQPQVTRINPALEFLRRMYEDHSVYKGGEGSVVDISSSGEVLIDPEMLRKQVWDGMAAKIQAAYRGMKARENLIKEFEKRRKNRKFEEETESNYTSDADMLTY